MRTELALILQIILESLPVSSSGNLALLGLSLPTTLNYVAHGATVLIYALFFRHKLWALARHPVRCFKQILHACLYGFFALVPTVFAYIFLEYTHVTIPLYMGFFITSLSLLSLTLMPLVSHSIAHSYPARPECFAVGKMYRRVRAMTIGKAFLIGCAQGVTLLPGISRLGITYVVGRWLGLSWRTSFGFSCMIEAPLIIAASCKGIYDLVPLAAPSCAVVCEIIVAMCVSYALLEVAYKAAQRELWWIFGVYVALLTLLAFALK